MPPWWLPRGGISLNILIASGAWMYNETYFLFACVQKRICDFMCAWMRYARVRKTEKPRVPHVQGLVENRNSGMRSTPRRHPIERPIALHSLPARPMRPDSHASLNLKPTHWLKPTYYTCNKGLKFLLALNDFLGSGLASPVPGRPSTRAPPEVALFSRDHQSPVPPAPLLLSWNIRINEFTFYACGLLGLLRMGISRHR